MIWRTDRDETCKDDMEMVSHVWLTSDWPKQEYVNINLPSKDVNETLAGEFVFVFADKMWNYKTIAFSYTYIKKQSIRNTVDGNINIKECTSSSYNEPFKAYQKYDLRLPDKNLMFDIVIDDEDKPHEDMKFRIIYDGRRNIGDIMIPGEKTYFLADDLSCLVGKHTLSIECECGLSDEVPTDSQEFWGALEFEVMPHFEKENFSVRLQGEGEKKDRFAKTADGCNLMIEVTNTCDVRDKVKIGIPKELGFSFDFNNVIDCGHLEYGKRNYIYILYSKDPKPGRYKGSLAIEGHSYPFEFEVFMVGQRDTRNEGEKPFNFRRILFDDGLYPKIKILNRTSLDFRDCSITSFSAVSRDGKTLWQVDLEDCAFEIHEYKDKVIVSLQNKRNLDGKGIYQIHCFDRNTGKLIWKINCDPLEVAYYWTRFPSIVEDDRIYSTNFNAYLDKKLYEPSKMPVYDANTGIKLNEPGHHIDIAGMQIWMNREEEKIYASRDGKIIWERSIYNHIGDGCSLISLPLSVNGGVLEMVTSYNFTGDGHEDSWYVLGINPSDGSIVYGYKPDMKVDVDGKTGRMFNRPGQ